MKKRKSPKRRPRLRRDQVDPKDLVIYMEALRGVSRCTSVDEHSAHMARAVGR